MIFIVNLRVFSGILRVGWICEKNLENGSLLLCVKVYVMWEEVVMMDVVVNSMYINGNISRYIVFVLLLVVLKKIVLRILVGFLMVLLMFFVIKSNEIRNMKLVKSLIII